MSRHRWLGGSSFVVNHGSTVLQSGRQPLGQIARHLPPHRRVRLSHRLVTIHAVHRRESGIEVDAPQISVEESQPNRRRGQQRVQQCARFNRVPPGESLAGHVSPLGHRRRPRPAAATTIWGAATPTRGEEFTPPRPSLPTPAPSPSLAIGSRDSTGTVSRSASASPSTTAAPANHQPPSTLQAAHAAAPGEPNAGGEERRRAVCGREQPTRLRPSW